MPAANCCGLGDIDLTVVILGSAGDTVKSVDDIARRKSLLLGMQLQLDLLGDALKRFVGPRRRTIGGGTEQ